jgi:sec-independent protein translocase protein TatA
METKRCYFYIRRCVMFGLGITELIIIMVIVLLIFGAGKLPVVGSSIGKAIKGFKKSMKEPDVADTAQANEKTKEKLNKP